MSGSAPGRGDAPRATAVVGQVDAERLLERQTLDTGREFRPAQEAQLLRQRSLHLRQFDLLADCATLALTRFRLLAQLLEVQLKRHGGSFRSAGRPLFRIDSRSLVCRRGLLDPGVTAGPRSDEMDGLSCRGLAGMNELRTALGQQSSVEGATAPTRARADCS